MKTAPMPSQDVLVALLDYDADTGVLRWRARDASWFAGPRAEACADEWNERYAGTVALRANVDGYRCGRLLGKSYKSHRIIWKLVYGEEPLVIDHINGEKADNRLANLRSVTQKENTRNARKSSANTSGFTGVKLLNNRWHAQAWHNGVQKHIGCFDTKEQAAEARKQFDEQHGYHPTHGRAA